MKTTLQALQAGFTYILVDPNDVSSGYWSLKFGDGYELCVEPLLFGQLYMALYQNQDLIGEKVPFKPIDKENQDGL